MCAVGSFADAEGRRRGVREHKGPDAGRKIILKAPLQGRRFRQLR